MAVHGSAHSMMVQASGPSMSLAHGGAGGAAHVGPLQDKLTRLLLNNTSSSPAKSSAHGSLIAAGRYDNLSASLSQPVKVCGSVSCHFVLNTCSRFALKAIAQYLHSSANMGIKPRPCMQSTGIFCYSISAQLCMLRTCVVCTTAGCKCMFAWRKHVQQCTFAISDSQVSKAKHATINT